MLPRGIAMSMGEAAKPFLVEHVKCLAQNARCDALTCLVLNLWFSSAFAVSVGEAAKTCRFRRCPSFKIGGSLEGVKVSKLEEVSHEMLVLVLPATLIPLARIN